METHQAEILEGMQLLPMSGLESLRYSWEDTTEGRTPRELGSQLYEAVVPRLMTDGDSEPGVRSHRRNEG